MVTFFQSLTYSADTVPFRICYCLTEVLYDRSDHVKASVRLTSWLMWFSLDSTGRSGPSRHPGGYWRRLKCPRQPVAGWRDANFLAVVLIHRAGKVFSLSADSIFVSRFDFCQQIRFLSADFYHQQICLLSADFCRQQFFFCQQILSADFLSKQSPFCQPILSTDFSYQTFLKHIWFLGSKHYRWWHTFCCKYHVECIHILQEFSMTRRFSFLK